MGAALALQAPNPSHGPYANQEGVKCYRGETRDLPQPNRAGVKKLVHCDCVGKCNEAGRQVETNDCQTYCAPKDENGESTQCNCHLDEACH